MASATGSIHYLEHTTPVKDENGNEVRKVYHEGEHIPANEEFDGIKNIFGYSQ